jgi:hypothetical protein
VKKAGPMTRVTRVSAAMSVFMVSLLAAVRPVAGRGRPNVAACVTDPVVVLTGNT